MSETHFLENPILPGFYPDPSCIRVGDTFYLINSSFQFFPGLPIHTSTNLVDWTLIGQFEPTATLGAGRSPSTLTAMFQDMPYAEPVNSA